MYSRSRSCLSKGTGKVPGFVKPHPRPSAPLDFLYPRWFSQAPAASQPPASDPDPCRVDTLEMPEHGQGVRISRYITDKTQQHLMVTKRAWIWAQYLQIEEGIETAENELRRMRATVTKRKELAWIVEKRSVSRAAHHVLRVRRTISDQHTASQRVLRRTIMKAKAQADLLWTIPARILSEAMQLPNQHERECVLLRERTIIYLTGTAHENTWIHNSSGSCEVHVLPKAPGSDGRREVLLCGSQDARRFTKDYLRAEDKLLHPPTGNSDEYLEDEIRWFPSNPEFDPDAHGALRPNQLPIPTKWSIKALAQFVEDVCALSLTPGLQKELFPGEETLHHNVATLLEELFTSDELTPYLSSHAFWLALLYTSKYTELSATSNLLYNRAKQVGLHRRTWIFNVMIERALVMKQMGVLEDLVKDMVDAKVVPDGMTWSKLLIVVPSAFARRSILDFILRVYPDELPSVLAHLARRLVEREMVQFVERPNGIQSFFKRMDAGFGPDWLTSHTLDKILKACVDHRLWQTADEMLIIAAKREIKMIPSTIKALMYLHFKRGDLNAAIDLLQSPRVLELGYDSTLAVHWTFVLAWTRKRYNLCRVLWQYAATRGLISYGMQIRVSRSLIRNQNMTALSEALSWNDRAGKLVIGTDLDTTDFDTQFPRLTKYFSTTKDPLQWLGQWTPNDGTRDEQLSLAYVMMHRDLAAWKVLKPMSRHDLPELLNAARRKDQAWAAEKFHLHATLAEMVANVIQVPLTAVEQHEAHFHKGSLPSAPVSSELETSTNAEALSNWRYVHLNTASSKMASWAQTVLNLSLPSPRSMNMVVSALQVRGRVPSTRVLMMWQYLAQRIGIQPTHTAS